MHHNPSRDKRLVLHLHIAGKQSAASDDDVIAQLAIVRNMPRSHNEVVISNTSYGFGLGSSRNGEMLANLVVTSDLQEASLPFEILIQRICTKYRCGTDFVVVPHVGPALDKHVGLKHAALSKRDILLNNAEFSNHTAWADHGIGMYSRSGRNTRPRVYGHK